MPKPGDVCDGCRERWEDKGKEPLILVASSGKTKNKDEVVTLCPYCDGDTIKISKLDNHDPLQDA
jgi:CDGSH-type Zn-finger protein